MSTTRSSTVPTPGSGMCTRPNLAVPMISIAFIDCQSAPTGDTASTISVPMVPALACPEISAASPAVLPAPA